MIPAGFVVHRCRLCGLRPHWAGALIALFGRRRGLELLLVGVTIGALSVTNTAWAGSGDRGDTTPQWGNSKRGTVLSG